MGRKPRILVPGVVYHVYNRVSSGERLFEEPGAAEELIGLMEEVKERDGWSVLAWCVMANHYHLVVRSGEAPLWRGLHRIQNLFSRRFNRRMGRSGPMWQSRYQAKVVEDEGYLWQLILYVHLNPVRAGVVQDPIEYPYSGQREIVNGRFEGLVSRDQALLCFGTTRRGALRRYKSAVRAAVEEIGDVPLRAEGLHLRGEPDTELWFDPGVPYLDVLGRSSVAERPEVSAKEFLEAAFEELGVDSELIRSRTKDRRVVRARRLSSVLAVERWGLRSRVMAEAMGRPGQQVSVWAGQGSRLRRTDREFGEAYETLDRGLLQRLSKRSESSPPENH
ncbi:MAG: transposase [Acidobacteria bacterium]|nr:transposase [Acidobacteriota bacterium]